MANPTETVHSSQHDEEGEPEQRPGGETSELGPQDDEGNDDAFGDAESIHLTVYDEQLVATIRRGGGVISNQKYNTLLEIRKRLMEYRDMGRISNLRREIKNLSWEFERMGSVTCRALTDLEDWGTLEDDMAMFADNYTQTNKPREKVRCKAPTLSVESWDGRPEGFFSWYAITLEMLMEANMEQLSEKIMILKALPEDVKTRCDHLETAGDIRRYLWLTFGTTTFLTKGLDTLVGNIKEHDNLEEFLDRTVPGILKVEAAIRHFSMVGEMPIQDVQMQVWNDRLLNKILITLHSTAIRLYTEEATQEASDLNRRGGWERSVRCFEIVVAKIRVMELTRDILIQTDNALTENKKRSYENKGGEVDRVTVKAMTMVEGGRGVEPECGFCAQTPGANTRHWALGKQCSATFMTAEAVEEIIVMMGMCAVCLFKHDANTQCKDKNFATGKSVICKAGCEIQGKPVKYGACKHGIEARKFK